MLIRNLDDDLIADYKRSAQDNGRSLEAELRDVLASMRPKKQLDRDELISLSQRLRALTPPAAAAVDSTRLIRAERDAR